jgi:hypothetical protein
MRSGYFNTSAFDGRCLTFEWRVISSNSLTNTSTISWSITGAGGGNDWISAGNFRVNIDGETVYSSVEQIKLYKGTVVTSGIFTLLHNENGAKSFTAAVEAGIGTVAVNCTGAKTFALDILERVSKPTIDNADIGSVVTIFTNAADSSLQHTARYEFGEKEGICIDADTGLEAVGIGSSVRWRIPMEFITQITDATAGIGQIVLDTYKDGELIGTDYTLFVANVPDNIKPTATIEVRDASGAKNIYGSYVKGVSELDVSIVGSAAYESPIKWYDAAANQRRYGQSFTLPITDDSTTIRAVVGDERRRTSDVAEITIEAIPYNKPAVTKLISSRCNADGSLDRRGEHIKIIFSAEITPLSGNTAQYKLLYKSVRDSQYTEAVLPIYNSVTDYAYVFAATSDAYDIAVALTDRHHTTIEYTTEPAMGEISDALKEVYPVGAVYTAYINTSPAALFGGEWEDVASTDGLYRWRRIGGESN